MTIESEVYAVVGNVKGILAVYWLDGKGILRRVHDVPEGII